MAITLKQIALGSLAANGATLTTTDVASGKIQVIKSIRLVNKHVSAIAGITTLAVGPTNSEIAIGPQGLSLMPGQVYLDDTEVVLKANDHLKVTSGSGGGPVEYVVSGFEREQS